MGWNFPATAYHLAFGCNVACNISWQDKVAFTILYIFLFFLFLLNKISPLQLCLQVKIISFNLAALLAFCCIVFATFHWQSFCADAHSSSLFLYISLSVSAAFIINAVVMTKLTILLPSRAPTSTQRRLFFFFAFSHCTELSLLPLLSQRFQSSSLHALLTAICMLICCQQLPLSCVAQLFRCSAVALIT